MTAAEAKHRADLVNNRFKSEQYTRLKHMIIKEVDLGHYRIGVTEIIQNDVKEKLESEGFKVNAVIPPYESTISWHK
jgi:hypothetical protein